MGAGVSYVHPQQELGRRSGGAPDSLVWAGRGTSEAVYAPRFRSEWFGEIKEAEVRLGEDRELGQTWASWFVWSLSDPQV